MRKLYYSLYLILSFCSLLIKIFKRDSKRLLILDIDNTLTYTWEYWHSISMNEGYYLELPLRKGTVKFVETYDNEYRIFLTARPFENHSISKQYLIRHNLFSASNSSLICMSPRFKVLLIRVLAFFRYEIAYIDDLSYNHENGAVKFYSAEIEIIKKMNIDYFGYHFIDLINDVS